MISPDALDRGNTGRQNEEDRLDTVLTGLIMYQESDLTSDTRIKMLPSGNSYEIQ